MMNRLIPLLVIVFALAGCRREDVREMTVVIPGLDVSDPRKGTKVVEAVVTAQDGVFPESYVWDLDRKTLRLKYDSMKVAQANIRYAIDEHGIAVEFPQKKDDHAGY